MSACNMKSIENSLQGFYYEHALCYKAIDARMALSNHKIYAAQEKLNILLRLQK